MQLSCVLFINVICVLSLLLDDICTGARIMEAVQPEAAVNIPRCIHGRNEIGDPVSFFSLGDEDASSVTRMIPEQFKFKLETGNYNGKEAGDEMNNFSSLDFLIDTSDGNTMILCMAINDQETQDGDLNRKMKDMADKRPSNFHHREIEDEDREDDSYEVDQGKSSQNNANNLQGEQLSVMKGKRNMRVFYPKTFGEDLAKMVIPAVIQKIFERKPIALTSLLSQQDEAVELMLGLIEQFFPNEEHENGGDQTPSTSLNTGNDARFLNDKSKKMWKIKTGSETNDKENWEVLLFSSHQHRPNAFMVIYADGDFDIIQKDGVAHEESVSISALFSDDTSENTFVLAPGIDEEENSKP